MNVQAAKKMIALLSLGLQLVLGALPLSGVVVCVAPGHVALELASGECAGSCHLADESLAPQCTDYGLAQSDAVPPHLRLSQSKRIAPLLVSSVPNAVASILPSQIGAVPDRIPTRTPSLRSLRTVILLV